MRSWNGDTALTLGRPKGPFGLSPTGRFGCPGQDLAGFCGLVGAWPPRHCDLRTRRPMSRRLPSSSPTTPTGPRSETHFLGQRVPVLLTMFAVRACAVGWKLTGCDVTDLHARQDVIHRLPRLVVAVGPQVTVRVEGFGSRLMARRRWTVFTEQPRAMRSDA